MNIGRGEKTREREANHKTLKFIYSFLEGEREQEREGQKERERERIPSRLCSVSTEPNARLEPMNHEIMT